MKKRLKRKKAVRKNSLYDYVKIMTWAETREFYKKCRESNIQANRACIHKWITGETWPTPYHAILLEKVTGGAVLKEKMRPDVFDK